MKPMRVTAASVLGLAMLASVAGTTVASPSESVWTIGITSNRARKDSDIYSMTANGATSAG